MRTMTFFKERPSQPPSKNEFAKLLIDRIRQAGERSTICYSLSEFTLQEDGSRAFRLWLGNAYKEYCDSGWDKRKRFLKHLVQAWLDIPKAMLDDFRGVDHAC
jgi:hypothetical protein